MESLAKRAEGPTAKQTILRQWLSESQRLGSIEYIFDVGNLSPLYPAEPGREYATLLQILQYPFSHGSIHIAPENPVTKPLIDPKYYGGEHGALDLEI
ncbi:hypothetical protein LTR85_003326 [Meristemomyces frigidus]|nr:hypothetical protein LTR85_003326 [Meristemomyces frigidus]